MVAVAVMSVLSMSISAQDRQTATLQHGDDLKVFYGNYALTNALQEAQTGDIITLSKGDFFTPTINKAVKIVGTGYSNDCRIGNTCGITLPEDAEGLYIEGLYIGGLEVYSSVKDFTLKRCKINYGMTIPANSKNVSIEQCRIYSIGMGSGCENVRVLNSALYSIGTSSYTDLFENCYIDRVGGFAVCRNCIIGSLYNSSDALCYNSVYATQNACIVVDCWQRSLSTIFEGECGWSKPNILTEEAAATYLGSDNTQVGMYGGQLSFTENPSNPKIVSAEVARKADNDGKLQVNIKVEAQQ